MIEEDNEIENLSKLNMLESLDLGIPLKYQKEESKEEDNFENEMNILLSKLNNQIETIKKKSKINFQFKPFNLDLNLDNSINNNNKDINNNIDDNMNLNINNNINYNMNNNNINNINKNNINSNNYNIKPSFNNLINEKKANNYITDNNTNNFINNHNITDNIDCSFNENTNNNNEKVLRNGNNNNNYNYNFDTLNKMNKNNVNNNNMNNNNINNNMNNNSNNKEPEPSIRRTNESLAFIDDRSMGDVLRSINFHVSSGLKVMISISVNRTVEELFNFFARKIGVSESLLGTEIYFVFNALTLEVNDKRLVSQVFFKDLCTITVLDRKNVIGAN